MLVYRSCRCCRHLCSKLLHTMFHTLAVPCIGLGFLAIWRHHSLKYTTSSQPHLHSVHSWLGVVTMGTALLQVGKRFEVICISSFVIFKFLIGVFSFLLLLCCRSTNSFRASLVPFHSSLGLATFVLAITTAIAGITEAAFYKTR